MGFLSKILGIDKVQNSINEMNKLLVDKTPEEKPVYDSISIIDNISEQPLMFVESISELDDLEKVKNTKHIGNAGKMLSLIQYSPVGQVITQSKQLEGAFRVVFPEGSIEKLMEYKNGLLGTPFFSPNKRGISGHAGLEKIQGMSVSPLLVFTAVSVVTGQYFMAQINRSLEGISKDVKEIISLMLDDKEAKNKAIFEFTKYIQENMEVVRDNADLRIASLTNLQSYLVELSQNISFYKKTIDRKKKEIDEIIKEFKTTNKRVDEIRKHKNEVDGLLVQQHICLELFVIGKMYEIQLAQLYDNQYYDRTIQQLRENVVNVINFNKEIGSTILEVLDETEDKAIINKEKIKAQKEEIKINIMERLITFETGVNKTIESISELMLINNKEQEYLVKNGQLYYVENRVA